MDFDLTEQQRLLQKTAKDFDKREIDPVADQIDREGRIPNDLIAKMAQIGLLGMNLPSAYGGAGASCLDCVLAVEQLAYSGTGAWWLAAFCSSIPESVLGYGTEEQKLEYLPSVCRGDACPSIQFTEADTGSDPEALVTKARRAEKVFVINGMKRFSTFGAREGFAIVYARDDSGKCTAFLTQKNIPGYQTGKVHHLMGSGGVEAVDVYFDNMELPEKSILGKMGRGIEVLQSWIAVEKIQQCGACLGLATAALDEAISFAGARMVRGRPQSGLQGIRWMLAEMHSKLQAARALTYRSAFLKDKASGDWIVEAASTKLFVVPASMEVVEMSRRIHGGYGYAKEFKIERLCRAIAGASAIAVSLEINKSIVGAALLK